MSQELELQGERLRFRRLSGRGPSDGWVSVRLGGGKPLLRPRPAEEAVAMVAAAPATGEVPSSPRRPGGPQPSEARAVGAGTATSAAACPERGGAGEATRALSLECVVRPYCPDDGTSLFCLERVCFDQDDGLLRNWVAEAEAVQPETFVDVAVSTSKSLLGYVAWALEKYTTARPCLKILSVAVAKHRRGKGLGEHLLRHVAAQGREKYGAVDTIRLTVREDNAPARRLYKRIGFRQVSVIKRKYKDCDGLDLELSLSPS